MLLNGGQFLFLDARDSHSSWPSRKHVRILLLIASSRYAML